MNRRTKISLGVVGLLLVAMLGGVAILVYSSATDPYPKTDAAWNAWLVQRLAEAGRTRGENWDAWLDARGALEPFVDAAGQSDPPQIDHTATDRIARVLDGLSAYPRFTADYALYPSWDDLDTPSSHIGRVREIARVLVWPRMEEAVREGRGDAAAAWLLRGESLRGPVEGAGSLIGSLVAVTLSVGTLQHLQDVLVVVEPGQCDELAALSDAVGSVAPVDPADTYHAELNRGLPMAAEMGRLAWPIQSRSQIAEYEQFMMDAAAWDDANAKARVAALADRLESGSIYATRRIGLGMLVPSVERTTIVIRSLPVLRDGVQALIALIAYRKDWGVFPPDLETLVPTYLNSVPADPFAPDGRLVYRVLDASAAALQDGVLLYSVGADGKDDGGVMTWDRNPFGREGEADYVFSRRVPERPARPEPEPDQFDFDHPGGGEEP
jgi:hypothetical protein